MEQTVETKVRKINTLQFGELEVGEDLIFIFPNGMLGFDELKEFVLITAEETVPFKWLLSVEKPEIGFPLLSPWHIDLTYDPGRDFDVEKQIFMVVVTLEDEKGSMTANLKAPIIFDVDNQTGEQVILPTDKYSPTFIIGKN
ncbi:MAG: flagellar assembly protein FliW [FCB group bacterium]